MRSGIQYVIDHKGKIISVVVPLKEWIRLCKNFLRQQQKLQVLKGSKTVIVEKEKSKKGNKIIPPFDFLVNKKEFQQFSKLKLSTAFDNDEPDYSNVLIIEQNLKYNK